MTEKNLQKLLHVILKKFGCNKEDITVKKYVDEDVYFGVKCVLDDRLIEKHKKDFNAVEKTIKTTLNFSDVSKERLDAYPNGLCYYKFELYY